MSYICHKASKIIAYLACRSASASAVAAAACGAFELVANDAPVSGKPDS